MQQEQMDFVNRYFKEHGILQCRFGVYPIDNNHSVQWSNWFEAHPPFDDDQEAADLVEYRIVEKNSDLHKESFIGPTIWQRFWFRIRYFFSIKL